MPEASISNKKFTFFDIAKKAFPIDASVSDIYQLSRSPQQQLFIYMKLQKYLEKAQKIWWIYWNTNKKKLNLKLDSIFWLKIEFLFGQNELNYWILTDSWI